MCVVRANRNPESHTFDNLSNQTETIHHKEIHKCYVVISVFIKLFLQHTKKVFNPRFSRKNACQNRLLLFLARRRRRQTLFPMCIYHFLGFPATFEPNLSQSEPDFERRALF